MWVFVQNMFCASKVIFWQNNVEWDKHHFGLFKAGRK